MKILNTLHSENEVLQRLNFNHIPILPPGITGLIHALSDDSIGFTQLAKKIELYPAIATRLIGIANSAWSGPVNKITSLEIACARLGFNIIRSVGIALAVASPFDANRCPGFNGKYFWTTALLAAEGATLLSASSPSTEVKPVSARAAGMMHNLGLLLLSDQLPVEVNEAIKLTNRGEYEHLDESLQFMLGFNHCDAGRLLAKSWQLPQIFIDAMAYQIIDEDAEKSSQDMAMIMRVTTLIVSALQQNQPVSIPEDQLTPLAISSTEITKIHQRLFKQLEKLEVMAETLFL